MSEIELLAQEDRIVKLEADNERLQTLADTRDMMLRQLRAQFDDMVKQRDAASADNARLRATLEAVLKGVQWDEKPEHINGLKTMVLRALEQAREK